MIFASDSIEVWILLAIFLTLVGLVMLFIFAIEWIRNLTTRTIYRGAATINVPFISPWGPPGEGTNIDIDVPGIGTVHKTVPQANALFLRDIAEKHKVEVVLKQWWWFGTHREFESVAFPALETVWRDWWLEDR